MSDNTVINAGSGGDTIRDKDRAGVKTQLVGLDLNPAGAESLMAGSMPVTGTVTVSNPTANPETGLAKDATLSSNFGGPGSGVATITGGGSGALGLLRMIWDTLRGGLAVTGTFWQATQPVSAAALPLPSGAATDVKSEAIRALLAGTLLVDSSAAVPTAIANAATVASAKYLGVTVRETAGAAAVIRVRDSGATGTILDTIPLVAGEGVSYTYPRARAAASGTVYVQVVSGTVEGSVFTA